MDEPHRGFRDRVEEVIPVLLDLTDQLRRNPRLSASHAASIAQLEMRVSDTLRAKGQNDRIFPIIEDAVELLRSAIERRPHDGKLVASYAKIRINGDLLRSESRPLEAPIEHFRHLAGILEPFAGAPGTISALASLQGYGMILASRLDEQGKAEVARALRNEVSEAFQRFRRDHPESWSISLLADLVRPGGPSRGPSSSMELVRSALRQAPEGLEIPEEMKAQLGVLIAKQLCDEHATGDAFRLDPEVVASRLLEALDDQFDGDEADRGLWFDILDQVSRMGSSQATRSRRAERIEETRWAIGWMFALGRALERRDPGDPGAHIVISRAFEQEHKLAWHLDDRDALEPALLGALTEATRVLALIPQNTLNRDHVAALREKYIRLVTQEPDPPGDESATRRSGRPAVQADPIPGDPEPSRPAMHSREVAVGGATRPEGRPVTPGAAGW
jgi:hypothetical protein